VGLAGASTAEAISAHNPTRSIRLHGTLRGQYQTNAPIPDAGTTYVLDGSGHIGGFGRASVTGAMHSLGFIAQGHAQGDLTLKGAGGTITLHLTALVQQAGFQPLPSAFSYDITGGTGRYAGAHGAGSATLTLAPGQNGAGSLPNTGGQFTLVLTS
jgi:hypothetical protein